MRQPRGCGLPLTRVFDGRLSAAPAHFASPDVCSGAGGPDQKAGFTLSVHEGALPPSRAVPRIESMWDPQATGRQAPRSGAQDTLAKRRAGSGIFRGWRRRVAALGCGAVLVLLLPSCAGGAGSEGESARYPEKKRPEPLRSASDGEVMGADGVSPDDRLEGSATPEHPGAGWVVQDGKLMPEAEAKRRQDPRREQDDPIEQGLTPPDCTPRGTAEASEGPVVQASNGAPAASANVRTRRTKPVCPPAPKP